jgi:hypothetical protein
MANYTRDKAADAINFTTVDNNVKAEAGAEPPMVQLKEWQDLFGDAFDAVNWSEGAVEAGIPEQGTVTEAGGECDIECDGAVESKAIISALTFGDGTFEIDVNDFVVNGAKGNNFGMRLQFDATNYIAFIGRNTIGVEDVVRYSYVGAVQGNTVVQGITLANLIKLKITRSGNNWRTYYDVGAGYVELGAQFTVDPGTCDLRVYTQNGTAGADYTTSFDVDAARLTGTARYWPDSPEADIVDSANIGGGESYAYDIGADKTWCLTGASSVEDGDGGTNKWKVGFSDAADGTGGYLGCGMAYYSRGKYERGKRQLRRASLPLREMAGEFRRDAECKRYQFYDKRRG